MSERTCSTCSKKLRKNNSGDLCTSCRRGPDVGAPVTKRKPVPVKAANDEAPDSVLAKFRVVADALGENPDAILADYAQGWLDRLRAKVVEP